MRIEMLNQYILVKTLNKSQKPSLKDKKTYSKFSPFKQNRANRAEIVKLGGKVSVPLKSGDEVVFQDLADDMEFKKDEFIVLHEDDIVAKLIK